ncbi:MAG: histidine phosphatase family protein [Mycobacterium sp.]|nr:histidine phosphatase family protein [Mycobacterium sp.]
MSRILLWRHGLTGYNAEGRIQGQFDAPLADEGLRQAEKAAELLAALAPTRIVSSDLSRARRTAEVLGARTGLSVEPDTRLRERHFGEWQGRTHAELATHDAERYDAWRNGRHVAVPGSESTTECGVRTAAALTEIASGEGPIVVVSHGGSIRYGLEEFLGAPGLSRVLRGLENCHWADVRPRGGRWILHAYNVGA